MKPLHLLFLFIALGAFSIFPLKSTPPFASSYSYKQYTAEDGLPDMMISCIFQDSRGFIWLGTHTGLVRFDGKRFEAVVSGSETSIVRITEAPSGNIHGYTPQWEYIVSAQGAGIGKRELIRESFLRMPISHGLPHGYAFYERLDNRERALFAITGEGVKEIGNPAGLNGWITFKMVYRDPDNGHLLIPGEKQVFISDEKGMVLDSIPQGGMLSFVSSGEKMWGIGIEGIYSLSGKQLTLVYPHDFALGTGVFAVVNREGELLIKDAEAIYRYDGARLELLYHGLVNPKDMLLDREGNLWVTSYKGLYLFYDLRFKNYTLTDREDLVRSVLSDGNDRLWAGTMNALLFCLDGNDRLIEKRQFDPDADFFYPYPTRKGEELFFLSSGLLRKNRSGFKFLTDNSERYLFSTLLPDGNLALTSNSRLHIATPEGKIIRVLERGDLGQSPRQVATDRFNRIWVTGMEGLSRIGDDISLIGADSLKKSFLVTTAPDGNIWFNAEDRIYEIEGDSIVLRQTIPGAAIRVLQFTRRGILIVGTLQGIYLHRPESQETVFYDSERGFRGGGFFDTNIAEGSDGDVWLPTLNHLIRFNPENLFRERSAPLIHLREGLCSSDNIRWETIHESDSGMEYPLRHVRFGFVGLYYSSPQDISYRYRLSGFQEEWSVAHENGEVTFNNLKPGRYEFQVKAIAGGEESNVISYTFAILPAFWQTLWFRILLTAVLLGLFAWALYRYFRFRNRKQTEAINRKLLLNELQVQSVRLRSIPHFNANVLSAIEYYILNSTREVAYDYLSRYARFTNQTLQEVDKAVRTLQDELNYIRLYLELEKPQFNYDFSYAIETEEGTDLNTFVPTMSIHTFCENAVKHGLREKKGPGTLRVEVKKEKEGISVRIEDNGIGREAASRSGKSSTGQGLSILKQQIELYNEKNVQKIRLDIKDLFDREGSPSGTLVELYIPDRYNYF